MPPGALRQEGRPSMPFDISNWMGLVKDTTKLSQLSIPGTHNSAARYIDPTIYKLRNSPRLTTQTDSLREQLDAGIRFFDIRVGYTNDRFELYHEDVPLNLRFGQVRDICKSFLSSHPRETIIVSLKKEDDAPDGGNTKGVTFQDKFDKFVAEGPSLWYLGVGIPTLGQVRGKIVLFRRFRLNKATPQGLGINAFDDFPGNATGTIEDNPKAGTPKLRIQDDYGQLSTSKASKYKAIEKILKEALAPGHQDVLYVNFASAAGIVPVDFPLSVANYINPKLVTYFNDHPKGRFGIIVTDFQTTELNTLIARTNADVG
jgi:1-phosphatidylinositol phosphodiesterase